MVEESDVLACGGYLAGEVASGGGGRGRGSRPGTWLEDEVPQHEAESSDPEAKCERTNAGGGGEVTQDERAEDGDLGCDEQGGRRAGDWSARVDGEHPASGAQEGGTAGKTAEKCENEANLCGDVCIAQPQEIVEVPANSGGVSGVDGCQTNPIFLETKPIPAGGAEAGGEWRFDHSRTRRPLTEREQRDAWKEIRRREWIRSRAEKEARERERLARLNAGVTNAGATSSTLGDAVPPNDVRGP